MFKTAFNHIKAVEIKQKNVENDLKTAEYDVKKKTIPKEGIRRRSFRKPCQSCRKTSFKRQE